MVWQSSLNSSRSSALSMLSHAGAQQLNLALLQDALFRQLHGQIQAGLAADAGNDGVRPLIPA